MLTQAATIPKSIGIGGNNRDRKGHFNFKYTIIVSNWTKALSSFLPHEVIEEIWLQETRLLA